MTNFVVKCKAPSGEEREKDVSSRKEGEEKKQELKDLGFSDIRLVDTDNNVDVVETATGTADEDAETNGSDGSEKQPTPTEATPAPTENLPDNGPSVDEDPLVWMPDEFTDTIDGTVAINRKGMEVLAHHYDIECETELCEPLTENGRVVFKATATDADGDRYSAFGSASKERGDDEGLLVEMADTRSYKRAISRATGVGMVAVEELQGEL